VPVPETPENGYQLTRDLADDLIDWMGRQKAIAPDRPFFAYFAPGATHAPISRRWTGAAAMPAASTWAGTSTAARSTSGSWRWG
jgi:arylsulfatase A-like enzyme